MFKSVEPAFFFIHEHSDAPLLSVADTNLASLTAFDAQQRRTQARLHDAREKRESMAFCAARMQHARIAVNTQPSNKSALTVLNQCG